MVETAVGFIIGTKSLTFFLPHQFIKEMTHFTSVPFLDSREIIIIIIPDIHPLPFWFIQ